MKKIALAITALILASVSVSAQEKMPPMPTTPSVNTEKVKGPDGESVMAFIKTYEYDADDIQDAIAAKLKDEGLKGSKAKNSFYAYKEVKYNALWSRTFDLYFAVTGSQKAGTLYLVLSTGYDNYITDEDPRENEKIAAWFTAIDSDIQIFIHDNKIEAQKDVTDDAESDLNSLKKKKANIEKKIEANEKEIKKFEASRTVIDPESTLTVDPKVLEKEQKTADKLTDKKNKLQYDLDDINDKISKAESKYDEESKKLKELKANRPK